MGWLGRLVGKQPPKVPQGGRPFVSRDQDGDGPVLWSVRLQMPGEDPVSTCKRLGPSFESLVVADKYLDWVTGAAASFEYPAGAA